MPKRLAQADIVPLLRRADQPSASHTHFSSADDVVSGERRRARAAVTVYRILRQEILSLARRPGDIVSERNIAQSMGLSRTPVREAILRLADEGMIDIFPQSGMRVARIPLLLLPDIVFFRATLEAQATREAVARVSAEQIRDLHRIVDIQEDIADRNDHEAFHVHDDTFHAHIMEAAGRGAIWQIIDREKVHLDRFRRLTLPVAGRMETVAADHRQIVRMIEEKDADQAARFMTIHLEDVLSVIQAIRARHPDLF